MGELIPYQMRTDDSITIFLLFSVLLIVMASVLLGRPLLRQISQMPLFAFRQKDASEIIASGKVQALLLIQTCIATGLFFFSVSTGRHPSLLESSIPTIVLLAIYILATILFLFLRWLLYQFIGWLFFETSQVRLAVGGWINAICLTGICILFLMIANIYLGLPFVKLVFLVVIVVFLIAILLFCWFLKLFYSNFYGSLLIFLYLCALEIIPTILMVFGMVLLNEYLILNY